MLFDSLAGWRYVEVTDHCTQVDYAYQMKYLDDGHYARAKKLALIKLSSALFYN